MAYVEWLRVRNTLRGFAIALGIMLAIVVIGRYASDYNPMHAEIIDELHSPTAKISTHVVASGAKTVIDDQAKNIHAEIVDYGFGRKSYMIAPIKAGTAVDLSGGSSHFHFSTTGVTSEDAGKVDISAFAEVALFAGLIVACFLGGAIGKENGQLAIAWTKPIDRTRLALLMFGIDAIGIAVGMILSVIVSIAAITFVVPISLSVSNDSAGLIALSLALPFAWYAFVTVATTSLKRRTGGVIAGLYFGAFLLPSFATILLGDSTIGSFAHDVLRAVAFFDPITYLNLSENWTQSPSLFAGLTTNAAVLTGLIALYGVASIVQWRRLEA